MKRNLKKMIEYLHCDYFLTNIDQDTRVVGFLSFLSINYLIISSD